MGANFRKRQSKLLSASEVLQRLFENSKSPISDPFLVWKLGLRWEQVLEGEFSKVSRPVGFSRGCLVIWVKDSVWMQEMIFFREEIIRKVNEHLGKKWAKTITLTLHRKIPEHVQQTPTALRDFLSKPPRNEDEDPPHGR